MRTQKGLSLSTFMFVLVVISVLGIFAMKIVPMYLEYRSVKTAMDDLAGEDFDSPKQVKDALMKKLSISYVNSVSSDDITITPSDGGYEVEVDYYVEKPLVDRISLTGTFDYAVTTK